jgi:hypothetical protein
MTLQINACQAGAFPKIVEEVDKDESPHMNTDETDEGAQDTCPAFDDDLDSEVDDFTIEDIVPTTLHEYADDFSETAFDSLPERRKWDHAIELEREPSPGF